MNGDAIGTLVAVGVGVLTLLGALWKFVVLPNLREQLFEPIHETRRQVTENNHANHVPTVLDRIDDLTNELSDVKGTIEAIGLSQAAVLRVAQRIRRLEQRVSEHETWAGSESRFLRRLLESLVREDLDHPDKRKG